MNIVCPRVRHLVPQGLCALLLATLGAPPVEAAPPELPPLFDPATAEHHVGKVIWADLVTADLAGAKSFYAQLFGWTFRDARAGETDYAVALLDGRPVAGIFHRAGTQGEHRHPAWLTFLAVSDVDAATRAALAHGGKVVREPKSYPRRGRQAILADPDGAVFAVLASDSGDPPDVLAAPGEWIWSSLLARDPATAAGFYQALFGYQAFDLASADGLEHVILSTDDYARAGVNPMPGESSHRHPHWLNFVRVADAGAAAARAVALGARVVVEPHMDRHGGRIAGVADPTGARVGLMEWPDGSTEREPK